MKTPLASAVVLIALAWPAQAQPPTISYTSPAAVAPGAATDVTVYGANLAGATGLWTSFPATVELTPGVDKNGSLPDRVVYRVTTPTDAQVGVGAIRVATGKGASTFRLVMIDDLPSVAARGDHRSLEKAQDISLPAAVDGACDALQNDFYRIAAKAGQTLTVDVLAQRIGSLLDPRVRLLDAAGRALAYSDDEPGVGADCRFAYKFTADGQYYLEIGDIRNQGGAAHRYRMRLGHFPLTTVPFPLGAQAGGTATLTAAGPAVDGVAPTTVNVPKNAGDGPINVSVRFPGGQGSGFVTVVAGKGPEAIETEPNDQPEAATKVVLPCAVNGRFDKPRDRDWYQFDAKKGQRLVFAGRTRSVGSPSDLFVRLYNVAGGVLAEAEDSGTNEGAINFTFPADGAYRLMVEDLLRRGGPEHAYRIEIEPYRPGFTLAVEAEKFDVPQEGSLAAKVTATRREYNGPIQLSVEVVADGATGQATGQPGPNSALDGAVLEGNVIPDAKAETQLRITLPPRIAAGQMLSLRIVGRAKIGDADVSAVAGTLPGLKKLMPQTPFPLASLDGLIAVGIGPVLPPFFQISAEPAKVVLPQLVATTTFKVKLKRLDNAFKTPISLAVEALPAGVTAEVKPVGKGETEYEVTLKGPPSLAESTTPIRIVGVGTHNNQTKRVVLSDVPLVVVIPLAVRATVAGPVAPGGKQKLKITVTRFGPEKAAVALAWKKRPTGVSTPEQLSIPADKSDVETELVVAPDAPLGTTNELVVTATTKVMGQDITVDSAAAALEIKK